MIRLAMAVGFMAVFGVVSYALVLLLTNHFSKNIPRKKHKPNN